MGVARGVIASGSAIRLGPGGSLKAAGLGDGWTLILGKSSFSGPAIPKQARSAAARRGLRLPPGIPAPARHGTKGRFPAYNFYFSRSNAGRDCSVNLMISFIMRTDS